MTTSSVRPVVLRNGAGIEDPLRVVLGFLKAPGRFDVSDPARPASFEEPDLKLANRGGARISAAQIAAILQRRGPIERALREIPPGASLSGQVTSVPWLPLRQLCEAFALGLGLVRGYQRDLHRNQEAVQAMRHDLTRRGYSLTDVRILDLLILSAQTAA